jgi:hypothetical protein
MGLQLFVGPWQPFRFLGPTHSQQDSLDGVSARRKAATYTQGSTNSINAHNTDIHASSGIRTHDPSVPASEDSSCLRPHGYTVTSKTNVTTSVPSVFSSTQNGIII